MISPSLVPVQPAAPSPVGTDRGRSPSAIGHADGKDIFFQTFSRRVGAEMAAGFTPEQMAAIRRAFGARQIGSHPIDVRRTFGMWGWDFYVVLLCGRETRSAGRRRLEQSAAKQIVSTLVAGSLVLVILAGALGVLAR